jgi:LPS-assembly protein
MTMASRLNGCGHACRPGSVSASLTGLPSEQTAIVTLTPRPLPPRRLLAVAAALALMTIGTEAAAKSKTPKNVDASTGTTPSCPLGSFRCAPRPTSFAMCRPNALLSFYDPTITRDSSLRDTANMLVDSKQADSSNKTAYHFSGAVRMQRADQLLHADTVDYNDQTTDYDANGHVEYQDAGQLMSADHMRGNNTAKRSVGDNVAYQMLQSHGNGVANQGVMLDADHTRYLHATYSTCDVGHHLWEVRAKNLQIDKDTGVGTARSATMRFANVPFMYLPYFTFPVDDRRKSGLLFPTFSSNSRAGYSLGVPYYLNLAPNYDATLEPRYFSKRGTMLDSEFRYLFPGTSGQLNFQYLPNDKGSDDAYYPGVQSTQGRNRFLLKYADNTALWPGWSFNTSINRVSDKLFMRDFGNDLYSSAIGTLASSAYVNGSGNWWSASFGADTYQNVDPSLPDSVVQYKRLPRATFNLNLPINHWLEFGMKNEAVAFRKDDVVQGDRLDLNPYIGADFQGAAWFVRPTVAYRYTGYQLDGGYQRYGYENFGVNSTGLLANGQASPYTSSSPSRSVPIVSLDSGLIFDRSTSLFGNSYTQTLEPRLYYLYVPYRNQNNLPIFDTALMSFDTWQLFTTNQYSGADRQMNANNLSGALTTRLLDDSGVERFSATFGQIRYFTPQRVQLPNGINTVSPVTDYSGSDYVVQLDMQLNDQWRLSSSYQWDPHARETDLGAFSIQRRLAGDGIINFSYRFRRNPYPSQGTLLEQYDGSIVYPVSERWRLIGQWTYSELDQRTVQALAGVQYESCCVKVGLFGRHYVTGYDSITGALIGGRPGTDNAVMLTLEFKGLGNLSSTADDMLRRGILGYQ